MAPAATSSLTTRGEKEANTLAMKTVLIADPVRYPRMTTQELRDSFLMNAIYQPGTIQLTYVDLDRAVVGMAVPLEGPLVLPTTPELRAAYFTDRRELGALNVGGAGFVHIGDSTYELDNLDLIYIGRAMPISVSHRNRKTRLPPFIYLVTPRTQSIRQRCQEADAQPPKSEAPRLQSPNDL